MTPRFLNKILPPRFHEATVKNTMRLSPHMIRISFQAEFAGDLSAKDGGKYLKLLAPSESGSLSEGNMSGLKQQMRTYTIRQVRPSDREIDIDFVAHGDEGIAGPWAARAQVGDVIAMSSPGPLRFDMNEADWFLFVADMAALPAAAATLENLPADATGDAYFEILSAEDQQPIRTPKGVNVHWIVKADCNAESEELLRSVRETTWRDGTPGVFVAGEFSFVGQLRSYFRTERPTLRSQTYISSYWKAGAVEPEHKAAKARAA